MKRFALLALATIALTTALGGCHTGSGAAASGSDSLYASCKPYTRWWWFAADIDTNDVRDQLMWLKDHEFGGVEIAWVYPMGLDSATAHPAFLSPQWSATVAAAKRMADSLHLGCDFTFGTLWPFNDVNLPDGDQTRTYHDSVDVALSRYTWDFPRDSRVLNHLDGHAFERYAQRMNQGLAAALRGTRSGLFVDSWEVETMYAWTPGFEATFKAEHGYDITPYMRDKTLMDTANAEVFYDYMHTLSGYVLREFYQPFAANASKVGAFSRAQCGGAPTDLLTAFATVDVPETEAILYEPSFSKIAASAATLGRKPAVTAETFTCAYGWTGLLNGGGRGKSPHQGREQIADLKLICDALFANGTNQIIWHGFAYNKAGSNDNHFYTTCQVSMNESDNLSGAALTAFNRYMTTVSQYMRRGSNYTDVAVYMPLEDSWMAMYYPEDQRPFKWLWGQYELRTITTPEALKGRQPQWVNEHFLAQARYADGHLQCGQAHFRSLCVDVQYMELSALRHVLRLAQDGLPVWLARTPREPGRVKHAQQYEATLRALQALPNVGSSVQAIAGEPLIEGNQLPDYWCRTEGDELYIFFANPLTQSISYPLDYCYAFSDRGSTRQITIHHHGKAEPYTLRFAPQQSLLLKVSRGGIEPVELGFAPAMMRKD